MINLLLILSVVILIAISAFFSSSEMALASSNKHRIKSNAEKGDHKALKAQYLLDRFTRTISTILIGNNLVNISASSIATVIFTSIIANKALSQTASTVTITLILLIFGEIFPKIIGATYCDTYVYKCSPAVVFCMKLFAPVVVSTEFIINKISPLWTPKESAPIATNDELVSIVDEIEDDGGFTEAESEFIKGAINFTEKSAKDILTPRVDVLAFDIDDGATALAHNTAILDYARFPVYRESLDHVEGVLNTRTFVCEYLKKGDQTDIASLLTPPLYVHMTRDISSILNEMREKQCEMAFVLDEFGGTLGIITVEDIVEEIVGDIFDESDDRTSEFTRRGEYLEVDGMMNIYDLLETLEYSDKDFDSEYTTVGGWATEMLDKLPEEGDTFDFDDLSVTVTKISNLRVEKLVVKDLRTEDNEDEEEE